MSAMARRSAMFGGWTLGLSALALVAVIPAAALAADAPQDEFLCQLVILCLSAPGGNGAHPECKSAMEVMFGRLQSGHGFPDCSRGGVRVSAEGYTPYFDCDPGWLPMVGEARVQVCKGMGQDGHDVYRAASARPTPQFVDVSFANGGHIRVWYARPGH